MNASYRRGLMVIALTVAVSAVLSPLIPPPPPGRGAENLGPDRPSIISFRLTGTSGRAVTDADLAGRVWIEAFIFTRCRATCPRISAVMKQLQSKLVGTGVELVSITVDPEHDTPTVLADYARRFGAEPGRWRFLTGPPEEIRRVAREAFLSAAEPTTDAAQKEGAEAIAHSARFALVDRGNRLVGLFDSDEPEAVARLEKQARNLDIAWVLRLPGVNASLNATSGVLLLLGWLLIRRGFVRGHLACMIATVIVSLAFLTCYLVYHYHVGSVRFQRAGVPRLVYFTILLSHTLLAASVVPLAALTLARAIRGRFDAHVRIARVTFPIWLYVSVTGVVVYLMLYQMHNEG